MPAVMMQKPALQVLSLVGAGLLALALVLWILLLLFRLWDNRQRDWRERVAQEWLDLLLPVLEGEVPVAHLPRIRSRARLEAVLGLLHDLNERFRGQYRQKVMEVLVQIGAEDFGLRLVRGWRMKSRLRGCALLSWTGASELVDLALEKALSDRKGLVRVEAAYAIALRHSSITTLRAVIISLAGARCLESDRVRDIVRLMAPERAQELPGLLAEAREPRLKVLLLDGIAAAGDFSQCDAVAGLLKDEDPRVRASAVRALELLADPQHMPQVAALTSDPDPRSRLAVARYAIAMGPDPGSCYMLWQLARDPNFDVQRTAVLGLAGIGGPLWERLRQECHEEPLLEALVVEAVEVHHLNPARA